MDSSFSGAPEGRTAPTSTPTTPPDAPDASPLECSNCGAPLTDAYCAACGQRAADRIVPLWQVTNEFLGDLFSLDLRILRTLPTFFFRPGCLTLEYVHGRRRRYVRPLRLYLFSSFLLFTVLAFTDLGGFSFSFEPLSEESRAGVAAARSELSAVRADLAHEFGLTDPSGPAVSAPPAGSEPSSAAQPAETGSALSDGVQQVDAALATVESLLAFREAQARGEGTAARPSLPDTTDLVPSEGPPSAPPKIVRILHNPEALAEDMLARGPYLMFFLVPTFALLLKLLYLRRGRLYLEHLIFALHVHALTFVALALSAGLGALDVGTTVHLDRWVALSPLGYLVLAMRRVYGQPMLATAGTTLLLLLAYGIILAAAVVGLLVTTYSLM